MGSPFFREPSVFPSDPFASDCLVWSFILETSLNNAVAFRCLLISENAQGGSFNDLMTGRGSLPECRSPCFWGFIEASSDKRGNAELKR